MDPSRWDQWMADALRGIDSSLELEENMLAHHPFVESLAAQRFARRFSPTGSALRELLLECITELIAEIEEEPGLRREREYLILWIQGCKSVSRIAEHIGITRSHCSNTVRRRVIQLLVAKFKLKVSGGKGNKARRQPSTPT